MFTLCFLLIFFLLTMVNLSKTPSSLHFSVAYWVFGCLIRRFRRGKDLALCRIWDTIAPLCGKVDEWLKSHAWKACIRASVSRVRIPSFPPVEFCIVYSAGCLVYPYQSSLHFLCLNKVQAAFIACRGLHIFLDNLI